PGVSASASQYSEFDVAASAVATTFSSASMAKLGRLYTHSKKAVNPEGQKWYSERSARSHRLPQLADDLPQHLDSCVRTIVPFLCGRKLLRQIDAAPADSLELKIDDRHRAEVIPLPAAADAVNKPLDDVCHLAS